MFKVEQCGGNDPLVWERCGPPSKTANASRVQLEKMSPKA